LRSGLEGAVEQRQRDFEVDDIVRGRLDDEGAEDGVLRCVLGLGRFETGGRAYNLQYTVSR
jgi:hypothetical protein